MLVAPYPAHGWNPAPGKTATGDPRVLPVMCGWCWGAGAYLERMELGAAWEHLPIRCGNCEGRGTVRYGAGAAA